MTRVNNIIITFVSQKKVNDLVDYKIYCFNGIPQYCQVICDRRTKETIDFFDMEWIHQPFVGLHSCPNSINRIKKPTSLSEMISAATRLSKGIRFLRVDFYEVNGKMYFGELTFYSSSGFGEFKPDEWNYRLGHMLDLKG